MSEFKKDRIGAWAKDTKIGRVVNFTINGVRYDMYENKYKETEKQPDFHIVVNDWKPTGDYVKPQQPPINKPTTIDDDLQF
jgi:hypothetical protein